jgi:hypothetical protein
MSRQDSERPGWYLENIFIVEIFCGDDDFVKITSQAMESLLT